MQPIVKKKRRHDEDDMQKALFSWITLATPRIPQLALAFAVPNGGKRDAREAARLKGLGVRPGVPDVMIPAHRGWHIMDPIRFQTDLRVTIQALGWRSSLEELRRYLPLQDDIASTAGMLSELASANRTGT